MAAYTFLLENEIKQVVAKEFMKNNYHQQYFELSVDSKNHKEILDDNSIYILVNDKMDIPDTASIELSSDDNWLRTSKAEYEFTADHSIHKFRTYLKIRTSNATPFVPYKLKFLQITPY